jgi:hypothetical protein
MPGAGRLIGDRLLVGVVRLVEDEQVLRQRMAQEANRALVRSDQKPRGAWRPNVRPAQMGHRPDVPASDGLCLLAECNARHGPHDPMGSATVEPVRSDRIAHEALPAAGRSLDEAMSARRESPFNRLGLPASGGHGYFFPLGGCPA